MGIAPHRLTSGIATRVSAPLERGGKGGEVEGWPILAVYEKEILFSKLNNKSSLSLLYFFSIEH